MVVGGATELPGAVVLAGVAALRAGAGKLQLASVSDIAPHVGIAVPEALVLSLARTETGGIAPRAAEQILTHANRTNAVLIGPGMVDPDAVDQLLHALLPALERPHVVLDAAALTPLSRHVGAVRTLEGRLVLTPHAGEMAALLGVDRSDIAAKPERFARRAADHFGAVVALKGPDTYVAAPAEARVYCYSAGKVGLATSGSGDTLAGVVAGLLARGVEPWLAAAWGVFLHGQAGNVLSRRIGPVGYLARELLDEIPRVMTAATRITPRSAIR